MGFYLLQLIFSSNRSFCTKDLEMDVISKQHRKIQLLHANTKRRRSLIGEIEFVMTPNQSSHSVEKSCFILFGIFSRRRDRVFKVMKN
jgi:hypothetical protein